MLRKRLRREGNGPEIPMTPVIDIVFLLLIYFLLTSQFITQEALKVDLPKSETGKATKQEEVLTITITKDKKFLLNGRPVPEKHLFEEVKHLANTIRPKHVYIEADRNVEVQLLITAMDAARKAGLNHILIKTKSPGP
ncbi:ExbD/TolR family protein [Thermodesulfatator atlanticus]|uniref:ExbD/TolR family protein n=1 Tax=Thermodesulfatator atlanticus TaxID=501497 RepID=UPI0003B30087|nr:biopolymer transporter ExbD [Thermodesulfatator atlanticus]